jgi:hypothetical protein
MGIYIYLRLIENRSWKFCQPPDNPRICCAISNNRPTTGLLSSSFFFQKRKERKVLAGFIITRLPSSFFQ